MRVKTLQLVRCEEIALPFSAGECFTCLCREPGVFFLDSAQGFGRLGRFSFLGVRPFMTFVSRGTRSTITTTDGRTRTRRGNPLEVLRKVLSSFHLEYRDLPVPFAAGAVGFLSYDLKHAIEHLPSTVVRDVDVPEICFAFYDAVLAFDHENDRSFITSAGSGLSRKVRRLRGEESARRLRSLTRRLPDEPPRLTEERLSSRKIESNFPRAEYIEVLKRTIEYIGAGDIFQANISQRFHTRWFADAHELFGRLREVNPAPFAAYLDFPGGTVLSSSPERFLKVTGRHVETRPIKGTRRRSGDEEADRHAAAELLASEKDNAELAMIVDLERNDLGRVCEYGTVRVTEPRVLETYPTVHHLVASVEGILHERFDLVDLLRATFPGGSITGAPKIRAMEIIDELEPTARGVYTGSIGYIDFRGNADLNIAIRTMTKVGEDVYFQAGGGIIADSVPEAEYDETVDKARALIRALGAPEWE